MYESNSDQLFKNDAQFSAKNYCLAYHMKNHYIVIGGNQLLASTKYIDVAATVYNACKSTRKIIIYVGDNYSTRVVQYNQEE